MSEKIAEQLVPGYYYAVPRGERQEVLVIVERDGRVSTYGAPKTTGDFTNWRGPYTAAEVLAYE